MDRSQMLLKIQSDQKWDLIVVGGGASGLGVALDSASRGYKTLLLEKKDFSQETSSRSTKLIHGGVRYLRQGYISLIKEALFERSLLIKNAPHLVHPLAFVLPTKNFLERLYYYVGIKFYDFLAAQLNLEKSRLLSKEETLQLLPMINDKQIKGGIKYTDGQFDDSRLAINLGQTFVEHGGTLLNYMSVEQLIKKDHKISGVIAIDQETKQIYNIEGKCVINATGAFIDKIRLMDDLSSLPLVRPSQGTHIIIKKEFFPGDQALIVPETEDGRVLFIIPWHEHVLIGTTETQIKQVVEEPKPLDQEIEYLLNYTRKYLLKAPIKEDILSAFAGIRPLVNGNQEKSSTLSRDHLVTISNSGLVTVAGGKWTTYRKIGADTVDQVVRWANLPFQESKTKSLPIHGATSILLKDEWSYYGSDEPYVRKLANDEPRMLMKLHPDLPCRPVDVLWAVRYEMARRVEDVLSRRTRSLLLGAKVSVKIAPQVAHLMAKELCRDSEWEQKEIKAYEELARTYIVD